MPRSRAHIEIYDVCKMKIHRAKISIMLSAKIQFTKQNIMDAVREIRIDGLGMKVFHATGGGSTGWVGRRCCGRLTGWLAGMR